MRVSKIYSCCALGIARATITTFESCIASLKCILSNFQSTRMKHRECLSLRNDFDKKDRRSKKSKFPLKSHLKASYSKEKYQ